jgi:hypothetical protein
MALAVCGLLTGQAWAGAPNGSHMARIGEPNEIELIDDSSFDACNVFFSLPLLACFQGRLVEDLFGNVTAADGRAQITFSSHGVQLESAFPVTLSGRVGGTFAHPALRLPIQGSGPVQFGDAVGTGKGSVKLVCVRAPSGSLVDGQFDCRTAKMPFCVDVPGVGRGCASNRTIPRPGLHTKLSAWDFSFELATDPANVVSGTGTIDLDTGEHVDLVATGKYDPRKDTSTLRFVSTPVAGITLTITRFSDSGERPTGRLDYKITGEAHARIDLVNVPFLH